MENKILTIWPGEKSQQAKCLLHKCDGLGSIFTSQVQAEKTQLHKVELFTCFVEHVHTHIHTCMHAWKQMHTHHISI